MQIPLDIWNASLWLAVISIILLITAQLDSVHDGNATVLIDQRKLKNTAIVMGMLFLLTAALRIYGAIST